eukprot:4460115-Pyramimonas_sp.AAC.1
MASSSAATTGVLAQQSARLNNRRAEVQAALAKSPSKASPPKKSLRTDENTGMEADAAGTQVASQCFAPAPAWPGASSGSGTGPA